MVTPVLYMLDTNMASYILKGRSPRARQKLDSLGPMDDVCISSITKAEIHYGLRKRAVRKETREQIESFLQMIDVLPWDEDVAAQWADLRVRLEAKGKTLASMDLLIAAHAIAVGATLVTHDGAFTHVGPDLPVIDWADDL